MQKKSIKPFIFETDTYLNINLWGEEIAHFTGKPAEISIGRKYYEVIPFISLEGKDALAMAISTGNAISLKDQHIPCLFARIIADIDIVPVKSVYGNINAVKVTLLPYSSCTIAHQLNRPQQMADIRKIASTLAHGVRNPVNAIKGAVVYLRGKYANEPLLTEFTTIIEEEISSLENFITNFLSSSVSSPESSMTDINSLLKNIEVLTSLQMYSRNISSTYEFGNIPPIVLNAFYLEQAILNVLNNAFEAMKTGGHVNIRTFLEGRNGASDAIIEISDTGPGMSRTADQEHGSGRGFGLFITQEILAHFGGRMEIEPGSGRGTTVRLCLPVKQPVRGVTYAEYRENSDRR